MAAKLLHSLADDNPDLQKQIGCMTGIFQIFDRQQIGRRIGGQSHKRLLSPSPGNAQLSNGVLDTDNNSSYNREAMEGYSNKLTNEKQRMSTESSRASFSSSSRSSSFSSLDYGRIAQPDPSSLDRISFPEMPSADPVISQTSASPRLERQSVDLRDVVKDSMYRDTRGLFVQGKTKEAPGHVSKHRDSPRPLQLRESIDGSLGVWMSEKQEMSPDLKESLRVLAKLREAPWNYNDKDLPRLSYDMKDGSSLSISKDAPRYSYDGRELNRLSFDLRDTYKSTSKTKDQPRLSLDSRESSVRVSNFDSKLMHLSRDLQRTSDGSVNQTTDPQQPSPSNNRSTSVVARLMGLDTLPDAKPSTERFLGPNKTYSLENHGLSSLALKKPDVRPIRLPKSPRSSKKEPSSPRWRYPDGAVKPISASKFPIEPAPWKHQDACRSPQKQASKSMKASEGTLTSSPSVFGEIEKRLKDLQFKQAGKDLRALKQIVEAMQAKGFLENTKEEQIIDGSVKRDDESSKGPDVNAVNSSVWSSSSSKSFESPIVIMKPANLIQKSGIPASSIVPIDGLPGLHRTHSSDNGGQGKNLTSRRAPRDGNPKESRRDQITASTDRKTSSRNLRVGETPTRTQQVAKDNPANTLKNSGSTSPRLQQRKLELNSRSRPPTPPPSDTNRMRRQCSRQSTEPGSPGGKRRTKLRNLQQTNGQVSEIDTASKNLSGQGDDVSVHTNTGVTLVESKIDMEAVSAAQSAEISCQSPSSRAYKCLVSEEVQESATFKLTEDYAVEEIAAIAPEQPSPVSVLDASVYREGSLSPVKQTSHELQGGREDEVSNNSKNNPEEERLDGVDVVSPSSMETAPCTTTEMSRKKLQDIENLVEKLRRLNSNHDEARTDYIASLCENTNPDHRYVSEILLASGLLLRDLTCGLTAIQLHASGHPINPELFSVLEQTKASSLVPRGECGSDKVTYSKAANFEKFHRKLLFDAVNELLVGKLALVTPSPEPWLKPNKVAKKGLTAQKLLRKLCDEIEELQAKRREDFSIEEEEDSLKTVLWEDVMRRSGNWTDVSGEISGMILDIERSIFKDLVDEVVHGEAAAVRLRTSSKHNKNRRCRQLFAKQ